MCVTDRKTTPKTIKIKRAHTAGVFPGRRWAGVAFLANISEVYGFDEYYYLPVFFV